MNYIDIEHFLYEVEKNGLYIAFSVLEHIAFSVLQGIAFHLFPLVLG